MHQCRGEKVLVLVMDCCSSGNCCLLDWLLTFLVDDLGLFSAAGIVYFWTNHGKGPADGRLVAFLSYLAVVCITPTNVLPSLVVHC